MNFGLIETLYPLTTTNEHHSIANKVAVLIWGSRESNDIIIANEVRSDVFNYIEFFYNPNRPHGNNDRKPD